VGQDAAEHHLDVAVDGEVCLEDLFQLGGVDVYLGDLLALEQILVPEITGALVEAGAQEDQQVGVVQNVFVGVAAGGDAETAERQGVTGMLSRLDKLATSSWAPERRQP
jgi:hypothetical protein